MPEGHKIHRIARAFDADFVGHAVAASSPQGRFEAGAELINHTTMTGAKAVGKQLFLEFDKAKVLRVHLGLYGMWNFAGAIASPVELDPRVGTKAVPPLAPPADFPAAPVGQVRVRLLTQSALADLRGPTTCEVIDHDRADAFIAKLGPDPLSYRGTRAQAESDFSARVLRRDVAIGALLMDQTVVAGIGNIYRAEMLFRARLNPFLTGTALTPETVSALWWDWEKLLKIGVRTGVMLTMDGIPAKAKRAALAGRADRHWVYGRTGEPCRVCGTDISMELMVGRKLYWCRVCQG